MFAAFPDELLLRIVGHIAHDAQALRTAALLSRPLLPIVRQELFTVMNLLALEHECMQPYLHLTHTLCVTGKPRSQYSPDPHLPPTLSTLSLPELKTLRFDDVNFATTDLAYLEPLYALGVYSTITILSFSRVVVVSAFALLDIISDLPTVTTLSLDRVTLQHRHHGYAGPTKHALPPMAAPRLTHLIHNRTAATHTRLSSLSIDGEMLSVVVARWLNEGPTSESLTTLRFFPRPYRQPFAFSRMLQDCLERGAPINHLSASISILHAGAVLTPSSGYTAC